MKRVSVSIIGFLLVVVCMGASLAGKAFGDYYKYTDSSGTVCITNKLDSVPARYRSIVKVIHESSGAAKKDSQRGASPDALPLPDASAQQKETVEPPTTGFNGLAARFPWFRPLVIVAAIVAGFIVVTKVSSLLPSALAARVVYLAFFLAVFVFMYKSYAEHLATSYLSIKTRMLAVFEKSNRRESPETDASPHQVPATETAR